MLLRLLLAVLLAGVLSAVLLVGAGQAPAAARLILFLLAPLPLYLLGLTAPPALGGMLVALAGAAAAALVSLADPMAAVLYAVANAIPAVLLVKLAHLHRVSVAPGTASPVVKVEWCPPGRIVLAATLTAGALGAVMMLLIGTDRTALLAKLKDFIGGWMKVQSGGVVPPVEASDVAQLAQVMLYVLPAASAISWLLSLLGCLWLAGRMALAAGVLTRPWPDLAALTYPAGTPALLVASIAGSFLPDAAGLAACAFVGGLYTAYVLLGLAIIHFVTRGSPWRAFILTAIYAGLLFTNIAGSLLIALLGLADGLYPLRARPPPGPGMPH